MRDEATFERDGLRLWYAVTGSGPPVIVHTGGGGDSDMFVSAGYVEALVNGGYRVVCFDHRGHGRSGIPLRRDQHRTREYVEDVVALLDALQLPTAAILGYSQGMHVAVALAALHPERVSAVVGIGSVGAPDDPADRLIEGAAAVRKNGMAASMRAIAARETDPPPAWLLDNLSSTESEVFALLLEGSLDDETRLWEYLPDVRAPALLIVGEREEDDRDTDRGLAASNTRRAARLMPDATAHVLPRLAHLAAFWRSDLTLPVIARFLREKYPSADASLG